MPYKDKLKDREWHKNFMRRKRKPVTPNPNVTPKLVKPLLHPPGETDGTPGGILKRPDNFKLFPTNLSKEYQAR